MDDGDGDPVVRPPTWQLDLFFAGAYTRQPTFDEICPPPPPAGGTNGGGDDSPPLSAVEETP